MGDNNNDNTPLVERFSLNNNNRKPHRSATHRTCGVLVIVLCDYLFRINNNN